MSSARRCSLMSGWRRMMPVAEHGASSRMRSNGRPFHQASGCDASPARTSARRPRRSRFSRNARQALRIAIEREQVDLGALENMRAFAAGRGAGVEDALAIVQDRAGRRRELRGAVLHREQSFAHNPADAVTSRALGQHDRIGKRVGRLRRDAGGCEVLQQSDRASPRRRLTRSHSGASALFAAMIASASSGQSRRSRRAASADARCASPRRRRAPRRASRARAASAAAGR